MFYNFFDNKANMKPLTILSILQMLDYANNNKTKISNLASTYHSNIFDFTYPLTSNLDKSEFEIKILKHYLNRRIGFETIQSFKIALDDKLNTIMPYYNILIDNIYFNNNLYSKTEVTTDVFSLDGTSVNTGSSSNSTSSSTCEEHSDESKSTNTTDSRQSDTPQNSISDVVSGTYLSNYELDSVTSHTTNSGDSSGSDTSTSNGTSTSSTSNEEDSTRTTTSNTIIYGSDLLAISKEIINIYNLIYKELDELFYGLI